MKRYRWAFLRVDPYYPAWDWSTIALWLLILVVGIFVIADGVAHWRLALICHADLGG